MIVVLRFTIIWLAARARALQHAIPSFRQERLGLMQRTHLPSTNVPAAQMNATALANASQLLNATSLANTSRLTAAADKKMGANLSRVLASRAKLRSCNAHPAGPMTAWKGQTSLGANIPFGTCREYVGPLKVGDFVHFKIGNELQTGVFVPSEPFRDDGAVLFVVHETDPKNQAMAAKMMFLMPLKYPQVVGVNVAPGAKALPPTSIRLLPKEGQNFNEVEELPWDQIRPIDVGRFDVNIVGVDGSVVASSPLQTRWGESYVLMRIAERQLVISDGRANQGLLGGASGPLAFLGPAAALVSLAVSQG